MTGMEDVLAAHAKEGSGLSSNSPDTCTCGAKTYPERGNGDVTDRRNRAFAAHVAEALAAAGFGNLHDAWAEGVATALNHAIQNDDGITLRLEHLDGRPWTNPYPKVSET